MLVGDFSPLECSKDITVSTVGSFTVLVVFKVEQGSIVCYIIS